MKTRLIFKAGQRGTKSLVEKYGEALLCVRYRYDSRSGQRLKTIELIVERSNWTPPPPRYGDDDLVPLKIEVSDIPMRAKAKEAGGKWDPQKKLWFVKYGRIADSPLKKHIHIDEI